MPVERTSGVGRQARSDFDPLAPMDPVAPFAGWTKAQLYARAKALGLPGRSTLDKAGLREALIARERGGGASSPAKPAPQTPSILHPASPGAERVTPRPRTDVPVWANTAGGGW